MQGKQGDCAMPEPRPQRTKRPIGIPKAHQRHTLVMSIAWLNHFNQGRELGTGTEVLVQTATN